MAVVLVPEPVRGAVPAELLDLGAETWRHAGLFADWLEQHQLEPAPTGGHWVRRFTFGRDRWAVRHGYTLADSNRVDHRRLQEAGVPWAGALTRAMAMGEAAAEDPAAFREACQLTPYGPVPDQYPHDRQRST